MTRARGYGNTRCDHYRRCSTRTVWDESDVDRFLHFYYRAVDRGAPRGEATKRQILADMAAKKAGLLREKEKDIRDVPRDEAGRPQICLHGVPIDACFYGCGRPRR